MLKFNILLQVKWANRCVLDYSLIYHKLSKDFKREKMQIQSFDLYYLDKNTF